MLKTFTVAPEQDSGQQPEDYPEPAPWVPDWEPEPEPTSPTGRAAQPRDEWFAPKPPPPAAA